MPLQCFFVIYQNAYKDNPVSSYEITPCESILYRSECRIPTIELFELPAHKHIHQGFFPADYKHIQEDITYQSMKRIISLPEQTNADGRIVYLLEYNQIHERFLFVYQNINIPIMTFIPCQIINIPTRALFTYPTVNIPTRARASSRA